MRRRSNRRGRREVRVNRRFHAALFIGTMVLFWAVSPSFGLEEQESLRGVKGIDFGGYVYGSDKVKSLGITDAWLRDEMELKIRSAGIKMYSLKEYVEDKGRPFLSMTYAIAEDKDMADYYYFYVKMFFYQDAELLRNGKAARVITWEKTSGGVVGKYKLKDFIKEMTSDFMTKFLNDFLSVNPK
jgi:hypothetical protein